MPYQYQGNQTIVRLADGRQILLLKGSVLSVNEIDKGLAPLIANGLLKPMENQLKRKGVVNENIH